MWRLMLLFAVALAGFWLGWPHTVPHPIDRAFPVVEHKSFVVVLYAYNQELWCQRSLRSIFEQDYDHYRVIMIDDGSVDQTEERAKQFILDNHQDDKVILIRNETRVGKVASLHRAMDNCLDREIVIPLNAKDWLSSPQVLQRLNIAYQNPDVWVAVGQTIEYPSYALGDAGQISYYAFAFQQQDGRMRKLEEPIAFLNTVGREQ